MTRRSAMMSLGYDDVFKAQVFTALGLRVGGEITITAPGDFIATSQSVRLIARESDGKFAVIWPDGDLDMVKIQVINLAGELDGERIEFGLDLFGTTARTAFLVSIEPIGGPNGGFLLLWTSGVHPAGFEANSGGVLYAQCLSNSFAPVGSLFNPLGAEQIGDIVSTTALMDGGFAAVFETRDSGDDVVFFDANAVVKARIDTPEFSFQSGGQPRLFPLSETQVILHRDPSRWARFELDYEAINGVFVTEEVAVDGANTFRGGFTQVSLQNGLFATIELNSSARQSGFHFVDRDFQRRVPVQVGQGVADFVHDGEGGVIVIRSSTELRNQFDELDSTEVFMERFGPDGYQIPWDLSQVAQGHLRRNAP